MYEHPARRAPSQAPAVFYFETEGMCIGENNIRHPGDHRERAEGERPGPGPAKQRWEAVFRRERRPVSLDRFFRFRHLCAGAGSVRVRERRSAPALIFY